MRETFLPFALPDVDRDELAEIKEALDSGWITTGPKTRQFEQEFAAYVGARHSIAVNSGTAAMHLALEAAGVGPGDLVITTPYTFAATAEVIRYFDAIPIFVDIEPDTLNIDPASVAEAVYDLSRGASTAQRWLPPTTQNPKLETRNLKTILPVHIAGHPCDLDAIYAIATEYGLDVIEDAAHAPPARYKGRTIGAPPPQSATCPEPGRRVRNSQFVCFSFYATKTLTTGEGGMITTDDEALAERCRIMSLHGISKDAWKRYTAEGSWYYEIIAPGYKYNMTDVAAAMGLAQLRKVERMWRRRKEIAACYTRAFSQLPELETPTVRPDVEHAWQLYILRLNVEHLNVSRNQFIEELKTRNISTSVHFIPLHLHPYYRETYGYQPEDFPVAYREYQRAISLPIYSRMSDQDVQDVIEAVADVVERGRR